MKENLLKILSIPIVKHVIFGIVLFVGVIFIMSIILKYYTRQGESIDLPDFRGKTMEQLYSMEDSKNFEFMIIDSVFMPQKPKGTIFNQDPPPESKVKTGRKVYLTTVAYGVPVVQMPDLIDLSLRQATNILESAGLLLGSVVYKPSQFHNAVFEQLYKGRNIKPGIEIKQGEKITLVVGKNESIETKIE